MKNIFILFFLFVCPQLAFAQNNSRNPCYYLAPNNVNCQPVSSSTPLPVNPSASSDLTAGLLPIVSGSASSGIILKAAPGNLYSVYATCTAACWLMIFNSVTIPADGATTAGTAAGNLQDCIPIAAGGLSSIGAQGSPPENFSVGISAAISSTACATKTAANTGYIHGSVK